MHLLKLDPRWNAKHAGHRHRDPVPRAPSPLHVPLPPSTGRGKPAACRREGREGKARRRKEGVRRLERLKVSVLGKRAATGLDPRLWIHIGGVRHAFTQKKILGLNGKFVWQRFN